VSGWDLVYDNGYIEIDPSQCGYSTFLGAAVPTSGTFTADPPVGALQMGSDGNASSPASADEPLSGGSDTGAGVGGGNGDNVKRSSLNSRGAARAQSASRTGR
jgi:hypothetical protein